MHINGVSIGIKQLASIIYSFGTELESYEIEPDGEDEPYGEIRIQVDPEGCISIHTGDSQYDQDHRGYWGYGSVPIPCSKRKAYQIAKDMLEDLETSYTVQASG